MNRFLRSLHVLSLRPLHPRNNVSIRKNKTLWKLNDFKEFSTSSITNLFHEYDKRDGYNEVSSVYFIFLAETKSPAIGMTIIVVVAVLLNVEIYFRT